MKPKRCIHRVWPLAVLIVCALAGAVAACRAAASGRLDRTEIKLGDSAYLTVTSSGQDTAVRAPVVAGLNFSAVGETSTSDAINGAQTVTTGTIYQATPERAGSFAIPGLGQNSGPLILRVDPGTSALAGSGSAALPALSLAGPASGGTHSAPDGTAFVRLLIPKETLYVGETTPVEIQVGVRPEVAASLNGVPTLNGDAFTFNPLSAHPEQTQESVGGRTYIILTWHTALAAIKPGNFSVTVDTPLTVQIRSAAPIRPRLSGGLGDDSLFGDPFNDPFFRSFFGTTTEKQIDVQSDPQTLKVLELPSSGRPADFSGAVGNFTAQSELSAAEGAVGDPLTLRMKISGEGNFDRVNSPMLCAASGWKTYLPSSKSHPADATGFSGEKDFEQAVIPLGSGREVLPALTFSYFDPDTRQYRTARTDPLSVQVTPSAEGPGSAAVPVASSPVSAHPTVADALRPDEVPHGRSVATLRPLYFQPWFLGSQGVLVLGFAAGLILLRRRERRSSDAGVLRHREIERKIAACLQAMDQATTVREPAAFFAAARSALQFKLADRWGIEPAAVTAAELNSRPREGNDEIKRVFALADEAAYSGQGCSSADFQQWTAIVRTHLKTEEER